MKEIAEWLAKLKNSEALEKIKNQCDRDLREFLKKSTDESKRARIVMQENRFWFGKGLYEHCLKFHAALHGVCTAFADHDFDKLNSQLVDLDDCRRDVLTTLEEIRMLHKRNA